MTKPLFLRKRNYVQMVGHAPEGDYYVEQSEHHPRVIRNWLYKGKRLEHWKDGKYWERLK